jgi:hypothetical protein
MVGRNNDKVVTALFVIILVVAVCAYIYVSLPKSRKNVSEKPLQPTYVLTIKCGNVIKNYTLDDIKSMPNISGYGGYVKKNNVTVGPDLYRGVSVKYLLQNFSLPENYSIAVTAKDGYTKNFSFDIIDGNVEVYNESGAYIGVGNVTMILAYEKNGNALSNEEGGPLRIAFVSEEGYITSSKLWARSVSSLEIKI